VQYTGARGNKVYVGRFDDEEAAARAYNDAVKKAGLRHKLNREVDGKLQAKPEKSSPFRGVYWHKVAKKWVAKVTRSKKCGLDGTQIKLGYFDDEIEAAKAVDKYIREHMPTIAAGAHRRRTIFFPRNKPANFRPRAGKVNFPSDEDELATGAAPIADDDDDDAEPRATAVVFPDATLGIELKLLEDENRIILLRATDASPAAALAPGLVLRSINGAAVVGACRPRDALAISKQIRGTPRPLTLEFVEGA
jgi:hypothetical protein